MGQVLEAKSMGREGWCILRTAGRHTLNLAESLSRDGFTTWAPVEKVLVVLPGSYHKRPGTYPLVPRYVFARDYHDQDLLRLSISRHRYPEFAIVRRGDKIGYVDDVALEPLRDAEAVAKTMAVPRKKISPYSRGAKVSVRKGAYAGMSGEVESSDGRAAKIWVTMFGRHQRVSLPIYFLHGEEARKAA